jgi:site-specific DNA-cytosine methylase
LHERRNVCFKQFGNSVAVPVIKRIFEKVQSALNDSSLQAA